MLYRELGRTGVQVSAIGLGTWPMGGTFWGGTDREDAIAAIRRALAGGITLIDTAPMYGFGLAEELLADALEGYDRGKVVIATKCGLNWWSEEGEYYFTIEGRPIYRNLRPASIRHEVEESLRRLRTDYIDLYQTHWQDPTTPIADTMTELLRLKDEGLIHAIGVSNASIAQMREYLAVGPLDANQPLYNMLARDIEQEVLPFCREHAIAILSYSSMARGLLTGAMAPDRQFAPGDTRASLPQFAPENIAQVNRMLDQFAPFRDKYGLDQTQLTIAWTISRPGVTCALVGVRNAQQLADVLPGANSEITPEDLEAMDRIIAALPTL